MGVIELMAIGNPIPDMTLTMGSAVAVVVAMLLALGVAAFGIWRQFPARPRVPGAAPRARRRAVRMNAAQPGATG